MSEITVATGNTAFITIQDAALKEDIYNRLAQVNDQKPAVEFRPGDAKVALVFSDRGEVLIGIDAYMPQLFGVQQAGGRFLVYVSPPADPARDGGGGTPEEPPPPDAICPCG